jgi:hypothetical protein
MDEACVNKALKLGHCLQEDTEPSVKNIRRIMMFRKAIAVYSDKHLTLKHPKL